MTLPVQQEAGGGDERRGRVALDHKGSDSGLDGVEGCWLVGTQKSSRDCPQYKFMQL